MRLPLTKAPCNSYAAAFNAHPYEYATSATSICPSRVNNDFQYTPSKVCNFTITHEYLFALDNPFQYTPLQVCNFNIENQLSSIADWTYKIHTMIGMPIHLVGYPILAIAILSQYTLYRVCNLNPITHESASLLPLSIHTNIGMLLQLHFHVFKAKGVTLQYTSL